MTEDVKKAKRVKEDNPEFEELYWVDKQIEQIKAEYRKKMEFRYRKGYSHGWHFAVEMMKEGFTLKEMEAMVRKVWAWRSRTPLDQCPEPYFSQRLENPNKPKSAKTPESTVEQRIRAARLRLEKNLTIIK